MLRARAASWSVKVPVLCVIDICKDSHQAKPWHRLDQDVLSFAVTHEHEEIDARCIAAWPRRRGHQSGFQQIACERNDRNGFRGLLNAADGFVANSRDDIDPCID